MRILDILSEEFVIPDLRGTNKLEVLKEFSHVLGNRVTSLTEDDIFKVLWERERLCSTGVGGGIAIPHGKANNLERPILCFGRSIQGVDFDSVDGIPVYLFFVFLSPDRNAGFHIRILAKIARLLKNEEIKKQLIKAKDRNEIIKIIRQNDSDF